MPPQSCPSRFRHPWRTLVLAAAAVLTVPVACAPEAPGAESLEGTQQLRPGIEVVLTDSLHLVAGRRAGLVTNHTGIDAHGTSSIDRLHQHLEVELVALFSPEHGIRGTAEAGELVDHSVDDATGLPVHSLYGETRKPTPQMLEGVEVLLFDIQDIGTRYYTYIYTMGLAMEAAGEAGIPFVVLDRPNPVGGALVQGNVLDPAFASFVGLYPIPKRHGMTPAELARLYRDAFEVAVELHIAPLDGWTRDQLFPDTGLPWLAPSPNMPDLESALHYPGTCLFEGTNLSVGRGTPRAFQQVGAPWIDGEELARRMTARGLAGVTFHPVRFTPRNPGDGKFADEEVGGVRLEVTDPARYDPARTGVALVVEARALSGDRWTWRSSHFDRLAGTDALRLGVEEGKDERDLTAGWDAELAGFLSLRSAALLY
ncbi:MAG: DUF1343 domain-containing protein [Gemmatimonadales bacterium]|nr:MAG: DUF1343 domain-containing protein [Gemmatimonadales bacterium]